MTFYPSHVSNNFQHHSCHHGECKGGCAAREGISGEETDEGDDEEGEEGGVCWEGDAVEVVGGADGAGVDGAVCVLVASAAGDQFHGWLDE